MEKNSINNDFHEPTERDSMDEFWEDLGTKRNPTQQLGIEFFIRMQKSIEQANSNIASLTQQVEALQRQVAQLQNPK
jgi:polyhydroxyalkanoate synthesis regulator phasin